MSAHRIVVIGASMGGVEALKQLVAGLPPRLPASCRPRMPAIKNR